MLATATRSIAYPSVTIMCNELPLELEITVEEGRFNQQESSQFFLDLETFSKRLLAG